MEHIIEGLPASVVITNIQRFSVHDGPGIRTTVFVKGCPLRCPWCQNPENLKPYPELMYYRQDCISCGLCLKACPAGAIRPGEDGRILTDRRSCTVCGRCVEACYPGARKICGQPYTVDEVYKEVLKDEVVYATTSGGVTLSGGEFTLYPEFAAQILERCRRRGIHTAIETCGYAPWERMELIARPVDLFLFDVKVIDPEKHRRWTGVDNRLILENARRLPGAGRRMIVRVPLIPKVNDDADEFGRIVEFAGSLNAASLHILPFHQLGKSKYAALDLDYALSDLEEPTEEAVERCREIAVQRGLKVSVGGSGVISEASSPTTKKRERLYIYGYHAD